MPASQKYFEVTGKICVHFSTAVWKIRKANLSWPETIKKKIPEAKGKCETIAGENHTPIRGQENYGRR